MTVSSSTAPRIDRTAFLATHRDELLGFLARRVPYDVAEDILQEVLVRSIDKVDAVRNEEALLAWMYRALRNATIDHYRRSGAADRALARFSEEEAITDVPAEGGVCRCVRGVAETLKPEQAAVLQRVAVDGVAAKDFATEAGISAGNAAVRLHRARQELRERLVATCSGCCGPSGAGSRSCTCAPDEKV